MGTIPVHLIAGFLGAGKTSAIRARLRAGGERIAVIVNDFGEAGFDEATLQGDAPFEITSIPGGCVCCTAPEGFVDALGAVLERSPDRLLIEPTGLARPQDLVDTIRRGPHRDALEVQPVIVLVDPRRLSRSAKAERTLVEEQAEVADVLVANHTDLATAEDLAAFDAWAAGLWPEPLQVHHVSHGRLPDAAFRWPKDEGARLAPSEHPREHTHGAAAHSTEGFRVHSVQWSPGIVFERERLLRAGLRMAEGLAGAPLARFKGVFRTREGVRQIEVAGGTPYERASAHRRDSRADLIFETDRDDASDLATRWLESAILSDQERLAQANQIEVARPDGRVHVVSRERIAALPLQVDDVSAMFPKRAGRAARVRALFESLDLPEAGHAVICAADGFASEPVPVAALCEGLLLHEDPEGPLSEKRGGPFRLLIPDGVPDAPSACANVKAVTRIVLREG